MPFAVDSSRCRRKVLDLYGEAGQRWLDALPALVDQFAARWSLAEVLPPYPNESYSYVAPVIRAGGLPAVLKVGVPSLELRCQIDFLRLCEGQGAARLLETDREQCAMLMERILPGDPLDSLPTETERTAVAAGVMSRIWRPAPPGHSFQTVSAWAAGLEKLRAHFHGGTGPFPPHLVEKAETLFGDLLGGGDATLIHGDMNPGNILLARRAGEGETWLSIDPKGVAGHPLYDVATYLNNVDELAPESEITALLGSRAAQFAEIQGADRREILAWGQAHAVLAGWWQYEDHNGQEWEGVFRVAELYNRL